MTSSFTYKLDESDLGNDRDRQLLMLYTSCIKRHPLYLLLITHLFICCRSYVVFLIAHLNSYIFISVSCFCVCAIGLQHAFLYVFSQRVFSV